VSIEDNKAAARRVVQAGVRGELSEDMLAEDFVFWNPTVGELPREAVLAMPGALKAAFKGDFVMTETGITAEGNRVAIEARSQAELITGEPYSNIYHFLIEFAPDGRVRRMNEHLDSYNAGALLKAIGLVTD
jgi:ketosteroid isomerase-like protein